MTINVNASLNMLSLSHTFFSFFLKDVRDREVCYSKVMKGAVGFSTVIQDTGIQLCGYDSI